MLRLRQRDMRDTYSIIEIVGAHFVCLICNFDAFSSFDMIVVTPADKIIC